MITRTFKLCLNAGTGSAPYINVSQYDEGETWLFELYSETGERYIPSTGAIVGVKSDGHGIANTGTVDSEGRVVIAETQQMTASAGRAIYELSIDGLTHGTANFIVAVERKPTDDAVMSDSDLSLIQEAIDSAEVIVEVIGDGDPSEVIGEHVDDWLDNHPEATTTVLDGAITAPKINNSLWDKLLVSEEAIGNPASFDDGADDVPVSSLKVALEPVQLGSGEPSPSNVRPIVASNGKNLAIFVDNKNVGTSGAVENYAGRIATVDAIPINAQTSYKVLFDSADTKLCIYAVWNGSTLVRRVSNVASNATLDTSGGTSLYVCIYSGNTPVTVESAHAMVVDSAITDSSYQPYQGIMVERCGKNLLNPSILTTFNSGNYLATSNYTTAGMIRCKPNTTYTLSLPISKNEDGRVYGFDANGTRTALSGTFGTNVTFTTGADTVSLSMYCKVQQITDISTVQIMLEEGSTASDYEPYIGTSYPYTLGQSVYGGTVDLATGVLTVDREYVTLTDATNWTTTSTTGVYYCSNAARFRMTQIPICDTFKGVSPKMSSAVNVGEICLSLNYNSLIFGTEYATLDGWTAYLSEHPVGVVRKLVEPETINLTPTQVKTLLGYNNISSSGTVDVIYHADTKLYVDKMTAVDNNIIAPTEEGFTATRNYTTNDLVIVNDTLYKVTANIASGSAITPNSNVQQTTLSALIKALS